MKVYVKLEGKCSLKWGVQRYHIRTRRELPGILLYSRLDIPYGSDGLYRTETVICVDGGEDSNSLLEERKIQKREVKERHTRHWECLPG